MVGASPFLPRNSTAEANMDNEGSTYSYESSSSSSSEVAKGDWRTRVYTPLPDPKLAGNGGNRDASGQDKPEKLSGGGRELKTIHLQVVICFVQCFKETWCSV
jgi:hypothetical protein